MKKFMIATLTAAATTAMLSAPSFADTTADNEPAFSRVFVNKAAKTDLSPAGFKTYRSKAAIAAFDRRYKVRGQGAADKR